MLCEMYSEHSKGPIEADVAIDSEEDEIIFQASFEGNGVGGSVAPLLHDALRRVGGATVHMASLGRASSARGPAGGGWTPSDDPVFVGAKDASGFDWRHMGVQMAAKAAYLGNHLQSIGSSEIAAAAMLGHASVESNFKVDAHNGRKEDSHGLFQLNDSALAGHRYSKYLAWARSTGRNPNDPLAQLDYAKVEAMRMRGPGGRSVWDAMQHAGSLGEANRIWMDYFENPKFKDYGNRLHEGQKALNAMRALGGKVPQEHPALAAPALPRREVPRSDAPVTSAHNELVGAVRKMTAAVERGGLHRVHVALEKGLTGKKTYSRGSVGATVA